MDTDDLAPPPVKKTGLTPPDFGPMSVADLENYIAALEGEIARARTAITAKDAHRAAAAAFFKS